MICPRSAILIFVRCLLSPAHGIVRQVELITEEPQENLMLPYRASGLIREGLAYSTTYATLCVRVTNCCVRYEYK